METINLAVNTTVDENDGSTSGTGLSLRDAVITVGQSSPDNQYIIELQGGSTYTLDLNGNDLSGGDLDLFNNVTIRAAGNEPAIIDASGLTQRDRVLEIYGNSNVNLENLVVTGGLAEFGGGIATATNTTVNLIDSAVTNNQSFDNGGGGIWSNSTNFNIRNSRVSGNVHTSNSQFGVPDGGGGIANQAGTLNIENSVIDNNSSDRGGGGIDNGTGGTIVLNNVAVSGNSSQGDGGGIETFGSTAIIFSTITDNFADTGMNSRNGGGGIAISGGGATILGTTIDNNRAANGGGGLLISNGTEATLYSSTISGNFAESRNAVGEGAGGGGIFNGSYSRGGGTLRIFNSTISGNSTNRNGGGIYSSNLTEAAQQTILITVQLSITLSMQMEMMLA